jgi:hypothetical protein
VHWYGLKFQDAVNDLRLRTRANLFVPWKRIGLEDDSVTPDRPVSVDLNDATLELALQAAFAAAHSGRAPRRIWPMPAARGPTTAELHKSPWRCALVHGCIYPFNEQSAEPSVSVICVYDVGDLLADKLSIASHRSEALSGLSDDDDLLRYMLLTTIADCDVGGTAFSSYGDPSVWLCIWERKLIICHNAIMQHRFAGYLDDLRKGR